MRTSGPGESTLLLLDVVDRLDAHRIGLDPQAFARVVEVPFQGVTLKFIGREDFIAMKAFAGGPTDLSIAADRDSLDLPLLRRVTRGYGRGAAETLERLLSG
jgi:predicted nucleotidyltransferase